MGAVPIGKVVRYHRKKSGLTQQRLGQVAGVGKTAIFDIEKGKMTVQLDTLLKVLDVLNVRIVLESPLMESYEKS